MDVLPSLIFPVLKTSLIIRCAFKKIFHCCKVFYYCHQISSLIFVVVAIKGPYNFNSELYPFENITDINIQETLGGLLL